MENIEGNSNHAFNQEEDEPAHHMVNLHIVISMCVYHDHPKV